MQGFHHLDFGVRKIRVCLVHLKISPKAYARVTIQNLKFWAIEEDVMRLIEEIYNSPVLR